MVRKLEKRKSLADNDQILLLIEQKSREPGILNSRDWIFFLDIRISAKMHFLGTKNPCNQYLRI